MGEFPRKADGRRVFTPEFKRNVVQQIQKGEKTLVELSRELDIYPTVIRTWKRRYEAGASTAVTANEDVVPASQLREAQQRIRELERLLGRKQMEIEILEAARGVVKKVRGCAKGPGGDWPPRDEDLPGPADGPADGLPPSAGPPRGILPVRGRRHGAPADPRRHQQPGHLRVPARVGHGEPDLPHGL
jgi:transposase